MKRVFFRSSFHTATEWRQGAVSLVLSYMRWQTCLRGLPSATCEFREKTVRFLLRESTSGGTVVPRGIHPRSWFSSRGLKYALVTSRKARSALPPSLVPKRVDSERSGAVGRRWAALARSKRGQCWMTWETVWRSAPHSGQLVGFRG